MEKNNRTFYGSKLKFARSLQNYTLAQLGQMISVSRQYLQRLETDPNTYPSNDMIAVLSEILLVEPTFFYSPIRGEVPEEVCHFRKRKTTPLRTQKTALAYGTIFNWLVEFFNSMLELPEDIITGSTVKNLKNIEEVSEQCRIDWGLTSDAPIHNVVRIIENYGGIVTTFEGVSDKIDAFSYYYDRPIVVRNDNKESISRARFDLAHELGHLVLHQDLDADNPELEDEANHFASAFLLPAISFQREFPKSKRTSWEKLIQMKSRWGVSLQAIIRRAYDLKLISAVDYRNSCIYINKKGWRTNEPGEQYLEYEKPEIIPMGFALLRQKGTTPVQIAKYLHLKPSIFKKFGIELGIEDISTTDENVVSLEQVRKQRNNM